MNIRGVVNSGVPFSVVDGGPSQQMAFEYPNDTYSVLPQSSALLQSAFPTLMLYEQGEMLTRAACDPIASVSGAINRIAYSMAFRSGFEHTETMNTYFTQISVSDTMEATMQTWIAQSTHVLKKVPFNSVSTSCYLRMLRIYTTSVLFNVIVERNVKTQVSTVNE
jgi:hypothetical protein